MVDFSRFDWGNVSTSFKTQNTTELTDHNEYERLFPVEEGDIVVDIGASVGPFTYSILSKKPKHCWVVEPMPHQFQTLKNNLMGSPVSFIKAAITDLKKVEIKSVNSSVYTVDILSKDFQIIIKTYLIGKQ